jgi:hypothetical protein
MPADLATVMPADRTALARGLQLDHDPVYGYAVRLATSRHLGGWKPCAGLPKCEHCAGLARAKKSIARRQETAAKAARWLGYVPRETIKDERNGAPVIYDPKHIGDKQRRIFRRIRRRIGGVAA